MDNLYKDDPMYFLNVRCNLKNYYSEIELFLDWLCPYMETEGFIGYMRYEECDDPVLIYKEESEIVLRTLNDDRNGRPKTCSLVERMESD